MNSDRKKAIVSIQDFLLNNPQALAEVKGFINNGIYDWSDDKEVFDLLNSQDQGDKDITNP